LKHNLSGSEIEVNGNGNGFIPFNDDNLIPLTITETEMEMEN